MAGMIPFTWPAAASIALPNDSVLFHVTPARSARKETGTGTAIDL